MNLAARNTKMPGKEADQVAIGLAVDGRRGQPDLQTLAMGAIQGVCRGAGLDMNGQQQVFSIPLVPRCIQRVLRYPALMRPVCRQPGAAGVRRDAGSPCVGSLMP